ncbi:MAG: glutamate synthase [Desulfovibrio sp.]|nr:glutamate synthase [Desulfovibrio sp.]
MCRIGAIKSLTPVSPSRALQLMLPQQEGHDNSGFAMVMQDLDGVFAHYKDKPLLSLACTARGEQLVNAYMEEHGFVQMAQWAPDVDKRPDLNVAAMPRYVFRNYDYPEIYRYRTREEREDLLLDTRLSLRRLLTGRDGAPDEGYVYSFWPDVLTLKEIGDPADIAVYFRLWEENGRLVARNIVTQCRQNTNYAIVRYAAHPFFLQGYTLCANGENTFFSRNRDFQKPLHRGYVGFESDSQCLLYTLHYVLHELRWPLPYYKHVITPLPLAAMSERQDREALVCVRESLAHLEINGPNALIALLPDGRMIACCDAKKLRPVVVGRDDGMAAITSEVCGLNAILPDRDTGKDIYPGGRDMVVIDNQLEVRQWRQ